MSKLSLFLLMLPSLLTQGNYIKEQSEMVFCSLLEFDKIETEQNTQKIVPLLSNYILNRLVFLMCAYNEMLSEHFPP